MYHEYPYTTYFHDIDKLCKACHDAGYKLLVDANALKLLNKNDEVVSTVVIHYAETALQDVDGKAIKGYIFNASTDTDELVFTKGDGTTFSLTIPYATKAEKDKLNKDLTSYVYEVQTSGNKIQIVKGDSTVTEITVPFATKALTDTNGKDIKTYAATMAVDGDNIVLKDSTGAELARLTAPYALKAFSDDDGDTFTTTYAATLEAGTTTVILKAKDGNTLSTITVPYATKAATDPSGNNFLSDYAKTIVVDGDGKRIGIEAHDGTRLATITIPFATLATDATNAVETISVVGDQLVFTTYGGQAYTITAPYAVKAQKDDAGNTIKSTYIASVTNDAQTGKLTFKDALGQTIVELTPTVSKATYDSYNNVIADYVKTILASASSDYVTVTHGDGDTEQITINYATHAWKDTNENVIKNTYIKRLACVEDVNDGHYKLVAYNGDNPEAELFRIELTVYMAQRAIADENGVNISQKNTQQDNRMTNIENTIANLVYAKSLNITNFNKLNLYDQNSNILSTADLPLSAVMILPGTDSWTTLDGINVADLPLYTVVVLGVAYNQNNKLNIQLMDRDAEMPYVSTVGYKQVVGYIAEKPSMPGIPVTIMRIYNAVQSYPSTSYEYADNWTPYSYDYTDEFIAERYDIRSIETISPNNSMIKITKSDNTAIAYQEAKKYELTNGLVLLSINLTNTVSDKPTLKFNGSVIKSLNIPVVGFASEDSVYANRATTSTSFVVSVATDVNSYVEFDHLLLYCHRL